MALRNQPYIPLYVQDYLTDEKLSMCSWATQGVYIKLLCLLHKSEPYGTILLKQNDKQHLDFASNFASKIMKLLPIEKDILIAAITELVNEKCLTIEGDKLFQRRMVRDNEISIIRSETGKKGGLKTQKIAKAKIKAKPKAKYEYENINENDYKIQIEEFENFRKNYPGTKRGYEIEFENFKKKNKDWEKILPLLSDALNYQISFRIEKAKTGGFVPEWKNLSTWINQRCWEEEMQINKLTDETRRKQQGVTDFELATIVAKHFAND